MATQTVRDLAAIVGSLSYPDLELARKIFAISQGETIEVINRITREGAQFRLGDKPHFQQLNESGLDSGVCSFCEPTLQMRKSPGFVQGKHSFAVSMPNDQNAYRGSVFSELHTPWFFTEKRIADSLEVAIKWLSDRNSADQTAACPLILWESPPREFGHAHMKLALRKGGHYPLLEHLKASGDFYSDNGRLGNLFEDISHTHSIMGLAIAQDGNMIHPELTPRGEKGVLIMRKGGNWEGFAQMAGAIYEALFAYKWSGADKFTALFCLPSIRGDYGWPRVPLTVRLWAGTGQTQLEQAAYRAVSTTDPYDMIDLISRLRKAELYSRSKTGV